MKRQADTLNTTDALRIPQWAVAVQITVYPGPASAVPEVAGEGGEHEDPPARSHCVIHFYRRPDGGGEPCAELDLSDTPACYARPIILVPDWHSLRVLDGGAAGTVPITDGHVLWLEDAP